MDSEPGRCRRTDGRKWRCSKGVVPLQKYCVSHMHRGRQGSRKHVESPDQSPVKHDSKISKDDSIPTISDTLYVNNSINRHSVEHDGDPGIQHSSSGNRISVIIKCRSRRNHGALLVARVVNTDNGTTKGRATSMNNGATNGNHLTEGKESGLENENPRNITDCQAGAARSTSPQGLTLPEFGSSPKCPVWCRQSQNLVGLQERVESEPSRCQRRDGKKWQCKRDALSNQKYCELHMHRGAKRFRLK